MESNTRRINQDTDHGWFLLSCLTPLVLSNVTGISIFSYQMSFMFQMAKKYIPDTVK